MAGDETTAQVAHSCETRFDRRAGKGRRADRLFGHIQIKLLQPALVVITREIGGQMRMRIHEARRKRRIAQVDHLRAARDWQIASRIENLIALHDHDGVLHERVRFTVKESRRFQRD